MGFRAISKNKVDGKAGHMNNIILICNQLKEVRTVGPTNTLWADFMGYEYTCVQLGIRGH